MIFEIKSLEHFEKQVKKLDKKSKELIKNKIYLIKQNPYRFKRSHSKKFSKVFRIWINLQGQKSRLIYVVIEPKIVFVCFLDRSKDYKDLEKYLRMLQSNI